MNGYRKGGSGRTLTPTGTAGWVEELRDILVTYADSIAENSSAKFGSGQQGIGLGMKVVARQMEMADPYLWKANLFSAAMQGSEIFIGTEFNVYVPKPVIFIPDQDVEADWMSDKGPLGKATMLCMVISSSTITEENAKYVEEMRGQIDKKLGHESQPVLLGSFTQATIISFDVSGPLVHSIGAWKVGSRCDQRSCGVQALFNFMGQKIVGIERHSPDHYQRRRLKRQKRPNWEVKVVTLRRYQQKLEGGGHGTIDWQCQWTVTGHWRDQWYPSKNRHEPIWIEPFVKGPPDKPLKDPKNTIFSVRR
jgi:hypothetical protein